MFVIIIIMLKQTTSHGTKKGKAKQKFYMHLHMDLNCACHIMNVWIQNLILYNNDSMLGNCPDTYICMQRKLIILNAWGLNDGCIIEDWCVLYSSGKLQMIIYVKEAKLSNREFFVNNMKLQKFFRKHTFQVVTICNIFDASVCMDNSDTFLATVYYAQTYIHILLK